MMTVAGIWCGLQSLAFGAGVIGLLRARHTGTAAIGITIAVIDAGIAAVLLQAGLS